MGGAGGMGLFADVLNGHADKAVAGVAKADPRPRGILVGVDHHGQVDVVEFPTVDQLLLAAEVADFSLLPKLLAKFDFHIFFGGYGHESDVAGQRPGDAREF